MPRICTGKYRRLRAPSPRPYGRVDLIQDGNTVQAATHGVRQFRLLISPDQFDFDQPIVVLVNGQELFREQLAPDAQVLLKWAARDLDRAMLFGAEIEITVP